MPQEERRNQILIVDDNPLNLKMLDLILQNANYNVLKAENGVKALELAREQKPALIFLDIMMPEMDGYEVCQRLKNSADTKDIPIIFLTSKTDTEGIVKGFELGAADYVTRPFNRVELLARLKTHLELRRNRDKVVELERRNSILAMVTTTNHEINQPLTVISGNLYLLKETFKPGSLSADQKKYFEKIDNSIKKIHNILVKYRNAQSVRFETYSGSSQMVVFDEDENGNGQTS